MSGWCGFVLMWCGVFLNHLKKNTRTACAHGLNADHHRKKSPKLRNLNVHPFLAFEAVGLVGLGVLKLVVAGVSAFLF